MLRFCRRCEHIRVFEVLIPHRTVKVALLNDLGLVKAIYRAVDIEIGNKEAIRAVSNYGTVATVEGNIDGVLRALKESCNPPEIPWQK